jgi:hypothetical protein
MPHFRFILDAFEHGRIEIHLLVGFVHAVETGVDHRAEQTRHQRQFGIHLLFGQISGEINPVTVDNGLLGTESILRKSDGVTIAQFKDIDDADIDELVFGKLGMEMGLTFCPPTD